MEPMTPDKAIKILERIAQQSRRERKIMRGYPGICRNCKHGNKMTVEYPCYGCIDNADLALHKPDEETEYTYFEPKGGLRYEGSSVDAKF